MPNLTQEAVMRWQAHVEFVKSMTSPSAGTFAHETKAEQLRRTERARRDYGFFVQTYFPHYCTDKATGGLIPCAPFHIKAARYILDNPQLLAVFMWPRGHAKSTHMGVFIPMWLMVQPSRTLHSLVLAGKSEDSAIRLLSDLQAELQFNRLYEHDFGPQYKAGSWAVGEFSTQDGTSFHAIGRGQSPRGLRDRQNRPDYIICDDLDDDELSRNPARVEAATDWTREALMGTFGAEGGRFIMVGNLISKCSVLANIMGSPDVHVSRVNVYDAKGNPAWPEYWSRERIEAKRRLVGYRAFEKEYMNNPITEGAVFKASWIRWKKPLPLQRYTDLVLYIDPSFKPTTKNDYKAAKLWGRTREGELHLLRCFCRQCTVAEMVRWLYDLHEELAVDGVQARFYMEANFVQDIILDEFRREGAARGYQLPVIPDKRKKPDKYQRIEAVSPLWERGLVFYNADRREDPDFTAGLEQTLAFEKGSSAHDDSPDADEGAIYMLQKRSRTDAFQPRIGATTRHRFAY